ncbi:hypothetical protein KAR91_00550 [Candidatus Pacearchaeota archaeon]|nr:hypothetical protein [Candidatus Pacearchaeota archaeon]
MDYVYIVIEYYDYEGSMIQNIFSSKDKAIECAENIVKDSNKRRYDKYIGEVFEKEGEMGENNFTTIASWRKIIMNLNIEKHLVK